MKKNIFALIALLSLTIFGFAQTDTVAPMPTMKHQVTLGLRGGLAMTTGQKNVVKNLPGGHVAFDVQYAPYWLYKNTYLGFLVGASVNYVATGAALKNDVLDQYSAVTSDGPIDYIITASKVAEAQQQLMVEIPVMFSLVDQCGVYFNFGPRFVFPVWTRSMVSFTDANILAYFPAEGVVVPNELVTGETSDWNKAQQAKWNAPFFRLMVGGELGYEFALKNGDALGLGLYADYEVFNDLDLTVTVPKSFIDVKAPTMKDVPAQVTIHSPIARYAPNIGMFDVGIKLSYHFNISK